MVRKLSDLGFSTAELVGLRGIVQSYTSEDVNEHRAAALLVMGLFGRYHFQVQKAYLLGDKLYFDIKQKQGDCLGSYYVCRIDSVKKKK